MDLSVLELLIPDLAAWLNVSPTTALLWLGVAMTVCNLIGRVIPDEATGWLARVRRVCKILGAYAPNRVESRGPALPPEPVEDFVPASLRELARQAAYRVAERQETPPTADFDPNK